MLVGFSPAYFSICARRTDPDHMFTDLRPLVRRAERAAAERKSERRVSTHAIDRGTSKASLFMAGTRKLKALTFMPVVANY